MELLEPGCDVKGEGREKQIEALSTEARSRGGLGVGYKRRIENDKDTVLWDSRRPTANCNIANGSGFVLWHGESEERTLSLAMSRSLIPLLLLEER